MKLFSTKWKNMNLSSYLWIAVSGCMILPTSIQKHRYTECNFNVTDINNCPHPDDRVWACLKKYAACEYNEEYHCARLDSNKDKFMDGCAQNTVCKEGKKPYLIQNQKTLHVVCDWCEDGFYNPEKKISSTYANCMLERTPCYDYSVECEPNDKDDKYRQNIMCRCNVAEDWIPLDISSLGGKICVSDITCTRGDPCGENEQRLLNSTCVKRCEEGYHRKENSTDCEPVGAPTIQIQTTKPDLNVSMEIDLNVTIETTTAASSSSTLSSQLSTRSVPRTTDAKMYTDTTTQPKSYNVSFIMGIFFGTILFVLVIVAIVLGTIACVYAVARRVIVMWICRRHRDVGERTMNEDPPEVVELLIKGPLQKPSSTVDTTEERSSPIVKIRKKSLIKRSPSSLSEGTEDYHINAPKAEHEESVLDDSVANGRPNLPRKPRRPSNLEIVNETETAGCSNGKVTFGLGSPTSPTSPTSSLQLNEGPRPKMVVCADVHPPLRKLPQSPKRNGHFQPPTSSNPENQKPEPNRGSIDNRKSTENHHGLNDQQLDTLFKKALLACRSELIKYFPAKEFLDECMIREDFLDRIDIRDIREKGNTTTMIELIIDKIEKKTYKDYLEFKDILRSVHFNVNLLEDAEIKIAEEMKGKIDEKEKAANKESVEERRVEDSVKDDNEKQVSKSDEL